MQQGGITSTMSPELNHTSFMTFEVDLTHYEAYEKTSLSYFCRFILIKTGSICLFEPPVNNEMTPLFQNWVQGPTNY